MTLSRMQCNLIGERLLAGSLLHAHATESSFDAGKPDSRIQHGSPLG